LPQQNFKLMTINANGYLIDLTMPKVMGVVNVNSDSFFGASRHTALEAIVSTVNKMKDEGAAMIDVGCMSSRPGAALLSREEEMITLQPILNEIVNYGIPISIDTVWSDTAQMAITHGASVINDISFGSIDEKMLEVVGSSKTVPYIGMHMRGTPANMQEHTHYENFMIDIINYLKNRIHAAKQAGIQDVLIDPGFGFAKTIDQNYSLLNNLNHLRIFDKPIVAGLSRKSMLYKLLDFTADDALNATTAAHMIALQHGASILRVHDVRPAVEAITIFNKVRSRYF
jgi:dihydropteroate synthase